MFRERIRVKTGCERCKARREKCNEQRPRCAYCTKWNLSCIYLFAHSSVLQGREVRQHSANVVEEDHFGQYFVRDLHQGLSTVQTGAKTIISPRPVTTGFLDPFNLLPMPDAQHRRELNQKLWMGFNDMVQGLTPFDVQLPRRVLAHEAFEAMLSDPAVCCAILSYAATVESFETQDRSARVISLEFQTRTEQLIQAKLNQGTFLENNVLLATSVHLASSAIENHSVAYLLKVANGIRAMINIRGASDQISANLPFNTIVSLIVSDNIVSRYTGRGPFLVENYCEPRRPHTLDRYLMTTAPTILQHWDIEVINVFEAVKFLLLFREPAFVARQLSDAESWYIFKLELWIDVRLNRLQAKHFGIGNVSEIATLTLLIIGVEVLVGIVQHAFVTAALLRSMTSAVQTYLDTVHETEFPNNVIVWACIVAAAGPELTSERRFFLETLHNLGLRTADEILNIAKDFVWHECLDHAPLSYEQLFS